MAKASTGWQVLSQEIQNHTKDSKDAKDPRNMYFGFGFGFSWVSTLISRFLNSNAFYLAFSRLLFFLLVHGPWSLVLGPYSLFLGPFTPSSPSGFPTHLRPGPFHHLLRHRPHMGWQGGQFSIRVLKTFLRAIRCGLRFAVQIARIKFHFNLTNCCQQSRSLLSWWIRSDMTGGLMDSWRYAWDWDANGSIWAYS